MNSIARRTLLLAAAAATTLLFSGCPGERIVPSEFDQVSPAFDGVSVVWEDARNEEAGHATDIYAYNVFTATESLVAGGAGEQDQPAVSNQYAVWIDAGRLKARDISGGPPFGPPFSVTNGAATQTDPAVCGSVVVWSDTANNSDVYAKDLAGGSTIPVATSPAIEAYPACDAGRVVYSHAPLGTDSDIRLYNIGTGQTQVVSSELWNEWRPAISGDRVVWQAWPTQPDTVQGIQILGTNLATGLDFVVNNGPNHQTAPAISGSRVAWEDVRSGQPEIWWRDLATTMPPGIPVDGTQAGSQAGVSIFGSQVVFQNNSAGPWNINLATVFFFAPPV
jgi:beta propeller repeat protein